MAYLLVLCRQTLGGFQCWFRCIHRMRSLKEISTLKGYMHFVTLMDSAKLPSIALWLFPADPSGSQGHQKHCLKVAPERSNSVHISHFI